jgi:hypothetical protein
MPSTEIYYSQYKALKRLNLTKPESVMVIELLTEILAQLKKLEKVTDLKKSKNKKNPLK